MEEVNFDMLRKNKPYKKNKSKIELIESDFDPQTIYVGAKSANNNAKLRIYNKKEEILHGRKRKS